MSPDPWGYPICRTRARPGSTHWAPSKASSAAIGPGTAPHLARLTRRQMDRQTDPFPCPRPPRDCGHIEARWVLGFKVGGGGGVWVGRGDVPRGLQQGEEGGLALTSNASADAGTRAP